MGHIFQDFKIHGWPKAKLPYYILFDSGISAVFLYRVSRWFWLRKLKIPSLFFKALNTFLNSCDISPKANFGAGLKIYHSVGVVIGQCEAGENVTILQNITIGSNYKITDDGIDYPTIGNNVTLFAGSLVAGPIIIGDNTIVGANTVLVKSVPAGSKVIGSKPVILNQTS